MTERRVQLRIIFAFALVYVFWGSTYLAIRIAVAHIPAALTAGLRFLVAGVLLLVWCRLTGRRTALTRSELVVVAAVGTLMLTGGNVMVCWAETRVPSGLAALVVAVVPIWVAVIEAFVIRGDRLSRRGVAGLALGVLGMLVLLWPKLALGNSIGHRELVGAAGLVFASLSWASGTVLSRRSRLSLSPVVATA